MVLLASVIFWLALVADLWIVTQDRVSVVLVDAAQGLHVLLLAVVVLSYRQGWQALLVELSELS